MDVYLRQNQKPGVVYHQTQIPGPRPRRPANEVISSLLMPAECMKGQAAQMPIMLAHHPVLQGLTRQPGGTQRMPAIHHGMPNAGLILSDQLNRDLSQLLQATVKSWNRLVTIMSADLRYLSLTCRQGDTQLPGKFWQSLSGLSQT